MARCAAVALPYGTSEAAAREFARFLQERGYTVQVTSTPVVIVEGDMVAETAERLLMECREKARMR